MDRVDMSGWVGFLVVVHCLPHTYQHDDIYLYGVIVPFYPTLRSTLFPNSTNIVEIRAAGRLMDEFWTDLPSYQYVAAIETRERINNYRILEYLERVPPPPPSPPVLVKKSRIIQSKKYKQVEEEVSGSSDALNRKIERQKRQMAKKAVEGLGEEYKVSGELDLDETERLKWLLHGQDVDDGVYRLFRKEKI